MSKKKRSARPRGGPSRMPAVPARSDGSRESIPPTEPAASSRPRGHRAGIIAAGSVGLLAIVIIAMAWRQRAGAHAPDAAASIARSAGPGAPPASGAAGSRAPLAPIPNPDLGRLNAVARTAIEQRRSSLIAAVGRKDAAPKELSQAYGDLGKAFLAARLTSEAEGCLLEAQLLVPDDFRWPHYLGYLYSERQEPDKAVAYYERALELKPDDTSAVVHLGNLFLERNQPERAAALFEKALKTSPSDAAALYGLGKIALSKKDYKTAAARFESALEASPAASNVQYQLALAYRGLGQTAKAERHLAARGGKDLLPRDPLLEEMTLSLPSAMDGLNRGLAAYASGRWAEAAAIFRDSIATYPDNATIRWDLGLALSKLGDKKGALEQFHETLRLSPGNAEALLSIAVLMAESGSHEQAIRYCEEALKSNPALDDAHLTLADELRRSGRYDEALAHYKKVVSLDPAKGKARLGLAMTLITLGRWADAKMQLEDAQRVLPDDAVFVHFLARLLATCPEDSVRDGARALDLARKAAEKGKNAALAQTMAMALAEVGRFDEAAQLQRSLIEAVRSGGRQELVPRLEKNLALYESRRPCRSFFLEEDEPAGVGDKAADSGRKAPG